MSKEEIAARLKAARLRSGMNQDEVAKAIGSTYQKVSSFETGRTRVDVDTLVKLCELYGADINYIAGVKDDRGELDNYLEMLHKDPKYRVLLDSSAKLDKEALDKLVAFIETLTPEE